MRIGELAQRTGVPAKTIRYYEQVGVLPRPARNRSGYRDYGADTAHRLAFIRQAQAAGLTLRQIRQILAIHGRGESPCGQVRAILAARLDAVRAHLAELVALEGHLESLLEYSHTGEPADHDRASVCWILEATTGYRTRADFADHASHDSVQS